MQAMGGVEKMAEKDGDVVCTNMCVFRTNGRATVADMMVHS
jgi:hypothetical protein